jgi:hypothetical protein
MKIMDTGNVTPIGGKQRFTSVEFRNINAEPLHPEAAVLSLHALFSAIRTLLGAGPIDRQAADTALGLATIGEHLAVELTNRM